MMPLRIPFAILLALSLAAAACTTDTGLTVSADAPDDIGTDDAPTDSVDDAGNDDSETDPEEPSGDTPADEVTNEPAQDDEPEEEPEDAPSAGTDDDAASAFASSLDNEDGLDQLDDAASLCVGIEMVGRFGGTKVLEMADDDYIPTADEISGMVDSLFSCTSEGEIGNAFAVSIVDGLGSDLPDEEFQCVSELYGSPDTIEQIMQLAVTNEDLDFEDLPSDDRALIMGPFLECVGFGTIMRGALAEDGVSISDETITCLNENGSAFVEFMLTTGDFDTVPDDTQGGLIDALFGCLTAEEIGELAG